MRSSSVSERTSRKQNYLHQGIFAHFAFFKMTENFEPPPYERGESEIEVAQIISSLGENNSETSSSNSGEGGFEKWVKFHQNYVQHLICNDSNIRLVSFSTFNNLLNTNASKYSENWANNVDSQVLDNLVTRDDTLERHPVCVNPNNQEPNTTHDMILTDPQAGPSHQNQDVKQEVNPLEVRMNTDGTVTVSQWTNLEEFNADMITSGQQPGVVSSPTGTSPTSDPWTGQYNFTLSFIQMSQTTKNKHWDVSIFYLQWNCWSKRASCSLFWCSSSCCELHFTVRIIWEKTLLNYYCNSWKSKNFCFMWPTGILFFRTSGKFNSYSKCFFFSSTLLTWTSCSSTWTNTSRSVSPPATALPRASTLELCPSMPSQPSTPIQYWDARIMLLQQTPQTKDSTL